MKLCIDNPSFSTLREFKCPHCKQKFIDITLRKCPKCGTLIYGVVKI